MDEIENEGGEVIENQAMKQVEDKGDPVVLEVHKTESVGSSGQMG